MSTTPLPTASRSLSLSKLPTWLWAPCALYAISAGCILFGNSKIVIPLYDQADLANLASFSSQMEKFYCLIALNIYEIALISVALIILLRRQVYDDAVALTLLIAIFLIASAVALDTIAPDFPEASFLFGLAGLLAAAGKLFILNRFITGQLPRLLIAALFLLLTVNFLLPSWLAYLTAHDHSFLALALPWRLGLYLAMLSSIVLITAAMRIVTDSDEGSDIRIPFLRTWTMHWIIALLLLVGSAAHLYALTWAFNVPVTPAELAPMVALCCLIILELLRGHGYRLLALDTMLSLAPLAVAIYCVQLPNPHRALPIPLGSPADPSIWLTCFAIALSVHAYRRGQLSLLKTAAPYLVLAVLLVGVDSSQTVPTRISQMNWNLAGFTLSITLAALAAAGRSLPLATAASLALAISSATCPWVRSFALAHHLQLFTLILMNFSALMLLTYGLFKSSATPLSTWFAFIAALTLAATVLQLFFPDLAPHMRGKPMPALNYPILASTLLLVYVGLIAIWTSDLKLLLPAAAPLALATFTQTPGQGQGWVWIALSFIILAIGAAASLRKGAIAQKWRTDESAGVPRT